MDFATIKTALVKGGKYATFDDVLADVQLIWDNCKTYNMAGSEIYKLAEYMEKLSKRTIQKFRNAHGFTQAPAQPAPPLPSKRSLTSVLERRADGKAKREESGDEEEEPE